MSEELTEDRIIFLKSMAQVNLLYNHVIRPISTAAVNLDKYERTPFKEGDTLRLNVQYLERSGHLVKMVKQVGPDRGEYHWGFHFRGDNGVWYRPNGTTCSDKREMSNDIISKFIPSNGNGIITKRDLAHDCIPLPWDDGNALIMENSEGKLSYNHVLSLEFSVESDHPKGEDITSAMIYQAISSRLSGSPQNLIEACLPPVFSEINPS